MSADGNAQALSPGTLLHEYRIDAVLIGRIEQLDSYDPVSLALEAVLVDCSDGTVLWTASGHFDARRADVQDDVRAWHRAAVGEAQQGIAGWRATLSSPALFARYVCDRLAHSVRAARWRCSQACARCATR